MLLLFMSEENISTNIFISVLKITFYTKKISKCSNRDTPNIILKPPICYVSLRNKSIIRNELFCNLNILDVICIVFEMQVKT